MTKRVLKFEMQQGIIDNPYQIKSKDVGALLEPDFGRVTQEDIGKVLYLEEDKILFKV